MQVIEQLSLWDRKISPRYASAQVPHHIQSPVPHVNTKQIYRLKEPRDPLLPKRRMIKFRRRP